uniref:Uncharacterized protein n=1 Tax=Gopherus evgoodei TaxID=1825980 RepID=A0A8C4W1D5_9SAUR
MFSSYSKWHLLLCLALRFHAACVCVSARSKSLVMGEQTGLPSRPSSPSLQDRVLKSGWLKKQRSIMKNWQQRWFLGGTTGVSKGGDHGSRAPREFWAIPH